MAVVFAANLYRDAAILLRSLEPYPGMLPKRMPIIARPVELNDFEQLRALFRDVWQRERDVRYDRMRFIHTAEGLPVAAVGLAGGEMAGLFSLWPMQLTDGRQVFPAGQAMEVMTHPRFRRQGVFTTLAKLGTVWAAERGWKVLYGAPNKTIYPSYLKHLAWASPAAITTYIRPLSIAGVIPMGTAASWLFRLIPAFGASKLEVRHERPDNAALDRRARIPGASTAIANGSTFATKNTGDVEYCWCALWRDGELAGLSISGNTTVPEQRLRRANLCDYIAPREEDRRAAILAGVYAARAAGANFVVAMCTHPDRAQSLVRCGFFRYKRSPLIVRTLDADSFAANPFVSSSWDLFGADFDFI